MTEGTVIPFPLTRARKLELPDLGERFPATPADDPGRVTLDAMALIADGMARLELLADTHPQELAALTTLDPALGQVDMDVRRLRNKLDEQRRWAYAEF